MLAKRGRGRPRKIKTEAVPSKDEPVSKKADVVPKPPIEEPKEKIDKKPGRPKQTNREKYQRKCPMCGYVAAWPFFNLHMKRMHGNQN